MQQICLRANHPCRLTRSSYYPAVNYTIAKTVSRSDWIAPSLVRLLLNEVVAYSKLHNILISTSHAPACSMQMSETSFPQQIRGAVQLTSDESRPHYGKVRSWSGEEYKRSVS